MSLWDRLRLEATPGEVVEELGVDAPSLADLQRRLQDAVRAYNSEGVNFIFDHFDAFVSIMLNENKLEWSTINKGFEYIERCCLQLYAQLETLFQNKEIDDETRVHNYNCLRVTLYTFVGLMKAKDSKLAAEVACSLAIGKRKKRVAFEEDRASEREWQDVERRNALDIIYNFLQLQLHRLWAPPLPDDSFVDMVAQPCYRMMEDNIIKNKTNRETVFQVLGILNKKYNHGLSCTIKLVQTIQLYEHAVLAICAGVNQLVTTWGLNGLVARLVRELGEALSGNLEVSEREGANVTDGAQRNCAQFLTELTQLIPAHMIPAAQTMRSYLENDECYPLRSSVLGMLCEIISRELKGEGLSEERRAMRDDFLDDLEEHIHDLSAYVRSRVLQYWGRLQKEGCVPVNRLQRVLARAIGRLEDKAALVRKSAIHLVKIFLEHNPYSSQLKVTHIEKQLKDEKIILEELKKKLNLTTDPYLIKKWDEMEDKVKETVEVELNSDSQNDPSFSQVTLDDSYNSVKKFLLEGKFHEAFIMIRNTEKLYPNARLLRSEMDKNDQVSYMVNVLRNVFVTVTNNSKQLDDDEIQNLSKDLESKENLVAFLEDCLTFSNLIHQAIPLVYTLLMSKQANDVNEAIDFFTAAHYFNIETATLGTMGMLQLVWSPDQEKRDAVDKAYRHIFLEVEGNSERNKAINTARSLVKLVQSVNRGQAAALQALLARWLQNDQLNTFVIQILWEMFTMKHSEITDDDSYAAMSLLVMISKAKPSVATANMEVIQSIGLSSDYRKCVLCMQLLLSVGQTQQRFKMNDQIFIILMEKTLEVFFHSCKFASFGTNIINVIYAICETPDLLCIKMLSKIVDRIDKDFKVEKEDDISYPRIYVEKLLVLLSQIALQQLVYLDIAVYGELRRRNEVRDQRKKMGNKKTLLSNLKEKNNVENTSLNCSSASAAGRLQRIQNQSSASNVREGEDVEEADEAGLEGAVADDADAELVRTVCEQDIVCNGILSYVAPLLHSLLQNPKNLTKELSTAACLTLGRFMLVSSVFCEQNMQLLMTLLKNSECSTMRCNIVITLSDLTLRFPNVIQPWTHYVYERLEDPCIEVRQCTVKMLSYLILQEMVRVRGQVAGLARCCVDDDPSTRTMARLFFKQLSQKGNTLYNIIPDIISRLSDPNLALREDHFRTILKYIMSLIQKDRQMEALVEKLCLRFKLSTNERQWRDLSYCLSLFIYNDRSIKKLIENIDCYKDKLFTKEVYDCFKTIITNTNKLAKADLKAAVAELNERIEENFTLRTDDEGNKENAKETAKTPHNPKSTKRVPRRKTYSNSDSDSESVSPVQKNKNDRTTVTRTPLRSRRAINYKNTDDSDSDEDEFVDKRNTPNKEVFKKPTGKALRRKK